MATHSNEYSSSNVTILRLRPPQEKLTKSDVDNLLIAKSPRIELVTVRGKSEVWQKFSRIRVDGKEVEFVACNRCRSTLTFKPTSGTNGMRSHRCHGIDDEPPLKLMRMECLPQLPQIPPSIIMPDISASQMRDFLDEAPLFVETKLADELVVFASNSDGEWNTFGCPQRIRHLSTVILDKGIGELLLRDLTEFLNSKSWYEERGVPYRRGYLLYGPPGCGKTSVIQALASELNHSICLLNLSDKKMTDQTLMQLMSTVPNRSFVVLEDVDAVFRNKESRKKEEDDEHSNSTSSETANRITFSGLLNTIDWVSISEGRIIFMTTNHIEKLDPALIRSGRVDRKQLLDYPSDHQLRILFTRFYPESIGLVDKFIQEAHLLKSKRSVAEIQGHFMLFKNDPKKAIEYLSREFDSTNQIQNCFGKLI